MRSSGGLGDFVPSKGAMDSTRLKSFSANDIRRSQRQMIWLLMFGALLLLKVQEIEVSPNFSLTDQKIVPPNRPRRYRIDIDLSLDRTGRNVARVLILKKLHLAN